MKFFRSVADEMKQVTWPTKKQLRKDTLVVIETSILFAAVVFIMDTVIQTAFGWILKYLILVFPDEGCYNSIREKASGN